MKKTYSILILFLILKSAFAFQYQQISDILFIGDDTLFFYDSPLEIEFSNPAPSVKDEAYYALECRRGYYAEWVIEDNILYLKNVFECHTDINLNDSVEKKLNKNFINSLMEADWVDFSYWAGMDFVKEETLLLNQYKYECEFFIKNGRIVHKREFRALPCRYDSVEALKTFFFENFDWSIFPQEGKFKLGFAVAFKIDSLGNVIATKILHSENYSGEHYNSDKEKYEKEYLRISKLLPCANSIYFLKGHFIDSREAYIILNEQDRRKYAR